MRGRLSIATLAGVRNVVPGIETEPIRPSLAHPVRPIIRTTAEPGPRPTPLPMNRMIQHIRANRWNPRRWNLNLGEDIQPIAPRAAIDAYTVPLVATVPTTTAPAGGFWQGITSGLSSAISGILPGLAQLGAARVMTSQQAALLRTQGTQLYTPGNIQTLQQQAAFEAAQRQVEQGRQLGSTSLPLSGTTMAIVGGGLLAVYLLARKSK